MGKRTEFYRKKHVPWERTCELPFYVGKVGRTRVADGEAWGWQALVAVQVNQVSRDR